MATQVSVLCRMSDGTFTYLRDAVTAETLTQIKTDGSGILNISPNLGIGTANQGKTATHALGIVQTDTATTGCWSYGAFYDPQGTVLCPIQGGGSQTSGLPALAKPVRLQSGVQVKVYWQVKADEIQIASVAAVCASGKTDIFSTLAVDDSDVSLLNKDGATWGQALAGQTVVQAYATYPATNGLADTGEADGVSAFYVESASGQLLGMYAPCMGGGTKEEPTPWIRQTIRVNQNDKLVARANI